jgi:hypothetical protein
VKRDEERIALSVDLLPTVVFEGRAEESAVIGKDLSVSLAELLEKSRRAFDVGEEEGDGPSR